MITKQNIIMWQKGIVWLSHRCQDINKHRCAAAARHFIASAVHVIDVFNHLEALQELMTSWRLFKGDYICALTSALLIPQHCIDHKYHTVFSWGSGSYTEPFLVPQKPFSGQFLV